MTMKGWSSGDIIGGVKSSMVHLIVVDKPIIGILKPPVIGDYTELGDD